jgi:hypothetical protein
MKISALMSQISSIGAKFETICSLRSQSELSRAIALPDMLWKYYYDFPAMLLVWVMPHLDDGWAAYGWKDLYFSKYSAFNCSFKSWYNLFFRTLSYLRLYPFDWNKLLLICNLCLYMLGWWNDVDGQNIENKIQWKIDL